MSEEFQNVSFEMPKSQFNTIKVIGVGGGGSNAVNHMYSKQIHGVDFVICNTDAQALESSPIPNKIQLGAHLTSGLGAGANPEIGAQAAAESIQEVQQMLSTNTKMVFITAGMGGGTGTGAAPIIAKIAKDMDILVVGIVTMPFQFEGKMRFKQAQKGVDQLRKNVDSLIVVNNNKLREVYGNLGFKAGFSKADEVLSTAAKGIAEVITHHYKQNIDLHDAKTVLSNSGTAIMGSAKESGEHRAKNAIMKALDSPLLNDNKITGAKNVLLLIVSGKNEVTLDEIGEINDFIQDEAGYDANIIMGIGEDDALEDEIAVTVVATGFTTVQQHSITNTEIKKVVHTLEDSQKAIYDFDNTSLVNKNSPFESKISDEKELTAKEEVIEKTPLVGGVNEDQEEIDFIINDVTEREDVFIDQQPETVSNQHLLFELPIQSKENLGNELRKGEIDENEQVKKRYTLEDDSVEVSPVTDSFEQTEDYAEDQQLVFQKKQVLEQENKVAESQNLSTEVSPLSLTINELKKRSDERREKLKQFNYKFKDSINNIDEIEKEPAYKRLGVDININAEISKTEIPLRKDPNSLNLSNNSFLHDNVD